MSQVACFVWLLPGVSKLCLFTIARLGRKKKRFEHCRLFLLLLKGGTILYTWSKYLLTAKSHIHNPGACTGGFSSISADSKWVLYWDISSFFVFQKKKKILPFILKVMAPLEEATRCFTMSHEYCQIRGCGRKLKLLFINTYLKYTAETCACIFIYYGRIWVFQWKRYEPR